MRSTSHKTQYHTTSQPTGKNTNAHSNVQTHTYTSNDDSTLWKESSAAWIYHVTPTSISVIGPQHGEAASTSTHFDRHASVYSGKHFRTTHYDTYYSTCCDINGTTAVSRVHEGIIQVPFEGRRGPEKRQAGRRQVHSRESPRTFHISRWCARSRTPQMSRRDALAQC